MSNMSKTDLLSLPRKSESQAPRPAGSAATFHTHRTGKEPRGRSRSSVKLWLVELWPGHAQDLQVLHQSTSHWPIPTAPSAAVSCSVGSHQTAKGKTTTQCNGKKKCSHSARPKYLEGKKKPKNQPNQLLHTDTTKNLDILPGTNYIFALTPLI